MESKEMPSAIHERLGSQGHNEKEERQNEWH
jgi:hypothetical protein